MPSAAAPSLHALHHIIVDSLASCLIQLRRDAPELLFVLARCAAVCAACKHVVDTCQPMRVLC
jgi:hypothetical protein